MLTLRVLVCRCEGLCYGRYGAHPDDGGDKGWTPLFVAALTGQEDTVALLLSYSACINEVKLRVYAAGRGISWRVTISGESCGWSNAPARGC